MVFPAIANLSMPLSVLIHPLVSITISEIRLPETMTLFYLVSITFVMLKERDMSETKFFSNDSYKGSFGYIGRFLEDHQT